MKISGAISTGYVLEVLNKSKQIEDPDQGVGKKSPASAFGETFLSFVNCLA
jgi:hypothetical protein